jgi:phosphohistidine swiveling domain-containing protein
MMPKQLHNGDPWMLGEHIPNCDLFFSTIWLRGFVSFFDRHLGQAYNKILCRYEDYNLWFYFGEKDSFEMGELVAKRVVEEPDFAEEINKQILVEADKLSTYSATIPQGNLGRLSDEELWDIYYKHWQVHSEYYAWAWIPVCGDMFHSNLTTRVKEYLRGLSVPEEKINEYFVLLTQPVKESLIFIEQKELLQIAEKIHQSSHDAAAFAIQKTPEDIFDMLSEEVKQRIQKHRDTYYYTKHLWVSGEYTIADYVHQLQDVLEMGEAPRDILAQQKKEQEETVKRRAELMTELGVDAHWQRVLDAYGDFMVTKIYRRYAQLLAVHHMSAILKEIAKRKYITEKQVRFATVEDVKRMLLEDSYDDAELLTRTKECIYYAERGFEHVYTGSEIEEIKEQLEQEIDTDVDQLHGEIGCLGYAKGEVKIIIRAEDMKKMNEGDILVSIATDPDIVPAMKKAAGIVTEQGGVTSHAAIVSRELGIPCVIGTKIATKVLQDGDMVEVDANKGIVKKV